MLNFGGVNISSKPLASYKKDYGSDIHSPRGLVQNTPGHEEITDMSHGFSKQDGVSKEMNI